MRALSIRQPWAELILRGIKTAELRSRSTSIVGERFYIYASKGGATKRRSDQATKGIWSRDLAVAGDATPALLLQLWEMLRRGELPTGVIVGSAIIERCVLSQRTTDNGQLTTAYEWHLVNVKRAK